MGRSAALAVLLCASSTLGADGVTPVVYVDHTRAFSPTASIGSATHSLLPEGSPPDLGCEGACDTSNCPFGFQCTGCETVMCAGPTKIPRPRGELADQTCQCRCACQKMENQPRLPLCLPHLENEPNTTGVCDQPQLSGKQPSSLPQNGSVALLIRGQAFRSKGGKKLCDPMAYTKQMEAATSLLWHVVGPLEALGNKVEVYATEDSNCTGLFTKLKHAYAHSRMVEGDERADRMAGWNVAPASGQAQGVRHALETFKSAFHQNLKINPNGIFHGEVPERYDLFIMTRHDILWKRPINTWETADFRRVNFLSRCEADNIKYGGDACVDDAVHIMPGTHFPAFDLAVGSGDCFSWSNASIGHGHSCLLEVSGRTHEDAAVLTEWRPSRNIDLREDAGAGNTTNPIATTITVSN